MTVCLQGGGEFSAGCREMDAQLLVGLDGPVVVTALAGRPGSDYRTASANGVRHFLGLGAADVSAAPDVREDPEGALEALQSARLLVLPGGSPSRLLTALTDTPVGAVVVDLLTAGGRVMGASAGAMVLGPWTVLPDRRAGQRSVVPGLGVVPVAVVPHWAGPRDKRDWVEALLAKGVPVLGLPEESGVLVEAGVVTAVGRRSTTLVGEPGELAVGDSWRVP